MSDFPGNILYGVTTVVSTGGASADISAPPGENGGTAVWPVANRAIYTPVCIEQYMTVAQMGWYNGATVTGNVDVGIYDYRRVRLTSAGSTAMSGASAPQVVDVTDVLLSPGVYFLAMVCDSGSATFERVGVGSALVCEAYGMQQQASALPLPATATFANPSQGLVPIVVASSKAVF